MGPWESAAARRRHYDPAHHKGRPYAASDCQLFVESDPQQAEAIWGYARKAVLCPASGQLFC